MYNSSINIIYKHVNSFKRGFFINIHIIDCVNYPVCSINFNYPIM